MNRLLLAVVAAGFALGVAGCGEQAEVTVYKQGKYQGKPDKDPWDNDQFKSDKNAWEKSVKARNLSQNEYVRITGN